MIGTPGDFISVGDAVTVKVKEIDDKGRVNLTMLGLKENEPLWANEKGKQTGGFNSGGGRFNGPPRGQRHDNGPRRGSDRFRR
ncbi:unnamed protein product [marine sediment metagenome]|uniref:S1 motif domain-containing protein n=1 Tax=marine sediment metagenome TaxID=412755 RepID=X1CFZ3_9ZZZZ